MVRLVGFDARSYPAETIGELTCKAVKLSAYRTASRPRRNVSLKKRLWDGHWRVSAAFVGLPPEVRCFLVPENGSPTRERGHRRFSEA